MSTAEPAPEDLGGFERLAWQRLEAGTRSHRAPFHSGVIATVAGDGPNLRTVILRAVDSTAHRLRFHTDRRSPKVAELAADAAVAWVFYDEPLRLQLRLWGRARLHGDDQLADAQWRATTLNSRRIYHAVAAPGSSSEGPSDGLPDALADSRWDQAFSEQARPNFVVVETCITRLDALSLNHAGHRRAEFRYDADGRPSAARWLLP